MNVETRLITIFNLFNLFVDLRVYWSFVVLNFVQHLHASLLCVTLFFLIVNTPIIHNDHLFIVFNTSYVRKCAGNRLWIELYLLWNSKTWFSNYYCSEWKRKENYAVSCYVGWEGTFCRRQSFIKGLHILNMYSLSLASFWSLVVSISKKDY